MLHCVLHSQIFRILRGKCCVEWGLCIPGCISSGWRYIWDGFGRIWVIEGATRYASTQQICGNPDEANQEGYSNYHPHSYSSLSGSLRCKYCITLLWQGTWQWSSTTVNSHIFRMSTVVWPNSTVWTRSETWFRALTVDIVQPDLSSARSKPEGKILMTSHSLESVEQSRTTDTVCNHMYSSVSPAGLNWGV